VTSGNSVAPTHKSFGRAHALCGYTHIISILLLLCYMEYNIMHPHKNHIGRTAHNQCGKIMVIITVIDIERAPCSVRIIKKYINNIY